LLVENLNRRARVHDIRLIEQRIERHASAQTIRVVDEHLRDGGEQNAVKP
jgi:hypothetical protein